ncbi:hypothetical protein [Cellulosilyticum ruminicola]|uniref:hypothetical protein n=1 Tax=Cellulosilyticum ruminicola TaxID=425254 RepID=UPI0006D22CEB|nr:hypothetical protein [Cellulosilyticum ruminicola]
MENIILNMKDALITTYTNCAYITSIRGDGESDLNWIYSNFIQIGYDLEAEYLVYDIHNVVFQECPYIDMNIVTREQIKNIRQVVQDALDHQRYVYIYINRKVLPIYFETEDFYHEICIYGYDEENIYFTDCLPILSSVDVNGLFAGGKYRKASCKFDDFEKAYDAMNYPAEYTHNVYLIQRKNLASYKIDINRIIIELEGYIYSRPTQYRLVNDAIYGMDGIRENIKLSRAGQLKRDNALDIRGFDLMLGHKNLMKKRLIYLTEQGYLADSEKYIAAYEKLEDRYKRMKDNYLKYVLSGRKAIFNKLMDQLEVELENETEIIKDMINYLKEGVC